ncbi:MAG: hypothetical protein ACP5G2_04545 [Candidatus Bipolaricaulaceae bacterium]
MRKVAFLGLLLASSWAAWGADLTVDSGAHLCTSSLGEINSGFVLAANAIITNANQRDDVTGEVGPLAPLRGGVGLTLGEALGMGLKLGARVAMATWSSSTAGTWTAGETDYPVSLALRSELLAVEGQLAWEPVPGVLTLGASGGWGAANFDYSCTFSVPENWGLTFQPASGEATYRVGGPVGAVYARATLPVAAGLGFGAELGFRFAPLGVPQAGNTLLDLDEDGEPEPLDFTGLWVGLVVQIAFGM